MDGNQLTQSGRLFQSCIVRYTTISPGQFLIGTNATNRHWNLNKNFIGKRPKNLSGFC